ncbi:hypothetical protein M408DRAFT_8865 [Serendipita vermifera MAFF 305830]|uniref:Uncharacterized protein n=1 Tax=Serendipita vermifera MAFF 305830 TaxID=933852 RepID=A0A0C3B9R7_SERVB|nr:hypothetical protein M408DRAFT_8865 [Serendipita vermifera MAFF 305830]
MDAGELGILLGLLLPNRGTLPGDRLRAAGGKPEGKPACGCVPDAVCLSGLVACLDGFVDAAFGTPNVELMSGDVAGGEEEEVEVAAGNVGLLAAIGDDELGSGGGVCEISGGGLDTVDICADLFKNIVTLATFDRK